LAGFDVIIFICGRGLHFLTTLLPHSAESEVKPKNNHFSSTITALQSLILCVLNSLLYQNFPRELIHVSSKEIFQAFLCY